MINKIINNLPATIFVAIIVQIKSKAVIFRFIIS